jgi:putative NADH-flavin reductase
VSGLVGHAILREALSSGYKVRAVIRRDADITKIKQAFAASPELSSKVDFMVVPDLATPNAFKDSVAGVASPMPHPVSMILVILIHKSNHIFRPIVMREITSNQSLI